MRRIPTAINDLVLIEPTVYTDARGHFFETFNTAKLKNLGIDEDYVQANQSASHAGVLRGLHFQKPPRAQSKLIRVLSGKIFDVAVDIRCDSPWYGKWFGTELSALNRLTLYIPAGFAHGFLALEASEVLYFCGRAGYDKASEGGIRFNDPAIGIVWPKNIEFIMNDRDRAFPLLAEIEPIHFEIYERVDYGRTR